MAWVPHTDGHHAAHRRILMRAVKRRLREELAFRREALDAAVFDSILVVWRVVLPTEVLYSSSVIPTDAWDEIDREWMLAWMGYGIRDHLEATRGIRPHPMMVKYRVFDERSRIRATPHARPCKS
jgi:hypothetical protein